MDADTQKLYGMITKATGGFYTVETSVGVYLCKARGVFRKKGITPVCGDRVEILPEDALIVEVLTRKNELVRPPLANLDCLVFVNSVTEPAPNLLLLDKFLAIAEYKQIAPVIVFTKTDLADSQSYAALYRRAGFPVFEADNSTGVGVPPIKEFLQGKFAAFTGNTGVGKSSLLNWMLPDLGLATGEISRKLGRGKHTTRHVELYPLDGGGYLADTPGFSTLETDRYEYIRKEDLADCFREFTPFMGNCRFRGCSHTVEKGCAVLEAVQNGEVSQSRHESYAKMYEEARQYREWEHKS